MARSNVSSTPVDGNEPTGVAVGVALGVTVRLAVTVTDGVDVAV